MDDFWQYVVKCVGSVRHLLFWCNNSVSMAVVPKLFEPLPKSRQRLRHITLNISQISLIRYNNMVFLFCITRRRIVYYPWGVICPSLWTTALWWKRLKEQEKRERWEYTTQVWIASARPIWPPLFGREPYFGNHWPKVSSKLLECEKHQRKTRIYRQTLSNAHTTASSLKASLSVVRSV